jgi:type IV pilus assembly protein PilY1
MRRGGNSIYAFDVTDPATPKLMWRITPNTAQFSQIGQTWSAPTVVKTAAAPDKPLLLVGGGYDTCEDKDPADCDGVTKGSQIYLIDAESGEHKQTFATNGRVIGDVTAVRYPTGTANAGLLKYAYAADLNGDVYRISGAFDSVKGFLPIDSTSPGTWVITQIASLGGTGVAQRKFMFAPDVVQQGGSISLLLGSGDREKPVTHYANATAVDNYFYRINDVPSDICWPNFKVSGACPATVVPGKPDMLVQDSLVTTDHEVFSKAEEDLDEGDRLVLEQTIEALAGARGWKLPLVASGEKTVTSALTIFGKIYFSTHQPAFPKPGQCGSNLGIAKTYPVGFDLPFFDADEIPGGGLPPSPVAGLVTLDDGKTVPFCIGCDASSPLEGGEPPPPEIANQPKARVFWNIENLE